LRYTVINFFLILVHQFLIIIATIIKPFSFRFSWVSATIVFSATSEHVFIHVFIPHRTHASLFLFLFLGVECHRTQSTFTSHFWLVIHICTH
jgi:hypothetical protein